MLPRTGSTALCSLLEQTATLGYPDEYFNPRGPLQHWAERLGARVLEEYVDVIRRERATENGVFGLKTTYDDFEPFLRGGCASAFLGEMRFVYLTRRDLVAQAVSVEVARQTGVWHRDREGRPLLSQEDSPRQAPMFDEERILEMLDTLVLMQQSWERFFSLYGIEPIRTTYEDLCARPAGVVAAIAGSMGVGAIPPVDLAMASTIRLADGRSAEWVRRIRGSYRL
jgi:trehalose 2-sulfotransferase